jgi:cytochrome c peroxidase
METLRFQTDSTGAYSGSPFDVFLKKNDLQRQPREGEHPIGYARRLKAKLRQLASPVWVGPADGHFQRHQQAFVFGPKQLEGLQLFLAEADDPGARGRHGACILCHAPPEFTDFSFHNMGVAQEEYDSVHGAGSFLRLRFPTLEERAADPDRFLPPSASHPRAKGPFQAVPSRDRPGETDLGIWNVFGNDAIPAPQERLRLLFGSEDEADDNQLRRSVALFKTPTLRDLGHSAPYFHTGRKDSIEAVLAFYIEFSALARARKVRNAAPELGQVQISETDVEPLRAFLRSLNEDFR